MGLSCDRPGCADSQCGMLCADAILHLQDCVVMLSFGVQHALTVEFVSPLWFVAMKHANFFRQVKCFYWQV